jgi:hypothetical protein
MDPRAGLDDVERRKFLNLLGFELQHLNGWRWKSERDRHEPR